jgi:hypothetical protein
MRTITTTIAVLFIAAITVGGLLVFSPLFRSNAENAVKQITQWTPENIEKYPVEYSKYVEEKLKTDQRKLQETRRGLSNAMEIIAKQTASKTKLLEAGIKIADEFAKVISVGNFPVTLHGKEYTADQANLQLSLTLAEIDSYKESVTKLAAISKLAEEKIQEVVVNSQKIETEIALLNTKREVFKASKIDGDALKILDQVSAVLDGTQVLLKENPVRTIDELLKGDDTPAKVTKASEERVKLYIEEYALKNRVITNEFIPVSLNQATAVQNSEQPVQNSEPSSVNKPIQSQEQIDSVPPVQRDKPIQSQEQIDSVSPVQIQSQVQVQENVQNALGKDAHKKGIVQTEDIPTAPSN